MACNIRFKGFEHPSGFFFCYHLVNTFCFRLRHLFWFSFRCGPLIDLCRGPHVRHTGKVKAFMVTKVNWNAQVHQLIIKSGRTEWMYIIHKCPFIKPPLYCNEGLSWLWLYGSWIYKYMCNQCLSPLKLWVPILLVMICTRYNMYVIKFVSDFWQICGFLRVLWFPRPIKPDRNSVTSNFNDFYVVINHSNIIINYVTINSISFTVKPVLRGQLWEKEMWLLNRGDQLDLFNCTYITYNRSQCLCQNRLCLTIKKCQLFHY